MSSSEGDLLNLINLVLLKLQWTNEVARKKKYQKQKLIGTLMSESRKNLHWLWTIYSGKILVPQALSWLLMESAKKQKIFLSLHHSLLLDLKAPSLIQPENYIGTTFCICLSIVPSSPSLIQVYKPVHLPSYCFSVSMQRSQVLGMTEHKVGVKKAGMAKFGCGICICWNVILEM